MIPIESSTSRTKLWLDDIRRPPDDSWIWARTIETAKRVVLNNNINEASLDHDMGLHEYDPDLPDADMMRVPRRYYCYCCKQECREAAMNVAPESCPTCGEPEPKIIDEPDGTEFAEWLVENELVPTRVNIHSWNEQLAMQMADILRSKALHVSTNRYERPGE